LIELVFILDFEFVLESVFELEFEFRLELVFEIEIVNKLILYNELIFSYKAKLFILREEKLYIYDIYDSFCYNQ